MTERELYEKIYAGWMGKNIGGTLGGPLEGRMELLDIHGYTQQFAEAVENDDLDLQLVNLHCVEQYGGRADMALLSQEWLSHVHFQFDEYGHSLTNMRRGLAAPLSGRYNNFFTDCMGSPIRSEIWAMLCAGMPDLAAYYAYHDASVDHAGGEGVYGEIFFAVLESLAFVSTDVEALIRRALSYLPEQSRVRLAVEHLMDCHARGMSWQQARQSIIDRFAGENFTYAPVNIAFTLIGLLYEKGFTRQMLTTVDCGYDTDCTVATLGALLGILYGPGYIDEQWTRPLGESIRVSRPITGFNAPRTIAELARRTVSARRLIQEHYAQQEDKTAFVIPYDGAEEIFHIPEASFRHQEMTVRLIHEHGSPCFAPGQAKELLVQIRNERTTPLEIEAALGLPEGFRVSGAMRLRMEPREEASCAFEITAPTEKRAIWRGDLCLTEWIDGALWAARRVPVTLLPTMDWRIECGGRACTLNAHTNRIELCGFRGKALTASTRILVPRAGESQIKIVCRNPIRAFLDGEEIIRCEEPTAVIPAYHRADPRKCRKVFLSEGAHDLKIELTDANPETELFCYLVNGPENCYSLQIDKVFLESACQKHDEI